MEDKKKSNQGAIFIPAGIFLGMGIGFVYDNIAAGLFIGMGAGFAAYGLTILMKK